jgi:hypothetical protein
VKDNSPLTPTACWQLGQYFNAGIPDDLLYVTAKTLIRAEALPGVPGPYGDGLPNRDESATSLTPNHIGAKCTGRTGRTAMVSDLIAQPTDITHGPGDEEPETRNRLENIDHEDKGKAGNQAFEKQGRKISSRCLVARRDPIPVSSPPGRDRASSSYQARFRGRPRSSVRMLPIIDGSMPEDSSSVIIRSASSSFCLVLM